MQGFATYHPAALFVYFLSAAALTMFTQNPLLLLLSFLGAAALYGIIKGWRALVRGLLFYLLFMSALALVNPLFNRQGDTVLLCVGSIPVTLESLLYGFSVGLMLAAVMLWFAGFSALMTAECFLYLFGGPFPRLAFLLSAAMRFVPLLSRQAGRIRDAQKAMGLYAAGGARGRLRQAARSFTALLTWSMENAVDTADSMEARGYGLAGGSRFSRRRARSRDILLLSISALGLLGGVVALVRSTAAITYFPSLVWPAPSVRIHILYLLWLLFFFCPCILEGRERIHWRILQSKI